MNVLIRRATLEDLEVVQKLNLKLFEKEHREYDKTLNLDWTFSKEGTQYYKEHITEDDCFTAVAVADNMIVGYLCGAICSGLPLGEDYRNLPIMAEVEDTFVLEEYRSKGIGSKLYGSFIDWCKAKKVRKLKVQSTTKNDKVINLYRKLGFKDHTLVLEQDI